MQKKKIIFIVFSILLLALIILLYWPAKNGIAKLAWDPNSEHNIEGYKIYYGTSPRNNDCPPGGYQAVIDIGKKTSYDFNNLINHKTYYFSVTSYNSAKKESCFSAEVGKKVANPVITKLKSLFTKGNN